MNLKWLLQSWVRICDHSQNRKSSVLGQDGDKSAISLLLVNDWMEVKFAICNNMAIDFKVFTLLYKAPWELTFFVLVLNK